MPKTEIRWCLYVWLAIGALSDATGVAAAEVPLACQDVAGAKERCTLPTTELAPRQDFQADVRISYEFPCHGHPIGAVINSGDQAVPLAFGGSGATPLILTGQGPFLLTDADPERTFRATLVGACVINVTTVDIRPSDLQLTLWKQHAGDLARLIEGELSTLRVTKSLQAVLTWDDDQLTATFTQVDAQLAEALPPPLTYDDLVYPPSCGRPDRCGKLRDAADMPAAWSLAAIANPDLPGLVALAAQIASIKAGRPAAYGPGDVDAAAGALAEDLTEAKNIIEISRRWTQAIDAGMRQLAERLETLQKEASAAGVIL